MKTEKQIKSTTKLSLVELEKVNGGKRKPLLDIVHCIGTYCYWP